MLSSISRTRESRGAAAVELALVLMLFLPLVFGVISYGYMLSFRQALSQGASEGARAAAVTMAPSNLAASQKTNATTALNGVLDSYGVACNTTTNNLERNGVVVGTCTVSIAGCVAANGSAIANQDCAKVAVNYTYRDHSLLPSFPGLGFLLPSNLTYSATARVS